MASPPIRLITLDLDDTLWPCAPVIAAAEAAQLTWLGDQAPALVAEHGPASLREHRRQLMLERPDIAHDLGEVRRLSIALLLESLGHGAMEAERLAAQAFAVFMQHRNRVEPFADAGPALRRLARGRCLISITNGNADPEQTALRGLFDHHISPAQSGAAKPDPLVFELALGLAGCDPAECLHAGDEPYLDVEAARALGLGTAWVTRYGRIWPADLAPPPLTVTDLHQLADWLDGGSAPGETEGRDHAV